jgi:hypothetical protein
MQDTDSDVVLAVDIHHAQLLIADRGRGGFLQSRLNVSVSHVCGRLAVK